MTRNAIKGAKHCCHRGRTCETKWPKHLTQCLSTVYALHHQRRTPNGCHHCAPILSWLLWSESLMRLCRSKVTNIKRVKPVLSRNTWPGMPLKEQKHCCHRGRTSETKWPRLLRRRGRSKWGYVCQLERQQKACMHTHSAEGLGAETDDRRKCENTQKVSTMRARIAYSLVQS